MKKISQDIIDKIVADYPHMHTKDVAEKHGVALSTCYHIAGNRKIKKTPERFAEMLKETNRNLTESGKAHRYKKGDPAWNKGKYMRVSQATEFKKGRKPHNYKPVGSERITKDGYLERKVAEPRKWRGIHLLVWEEVNGPVPPRHKVIFIDNNKMNVSIDNLLLITFEEAMRRKDNPPLSQRNQRSNQNNIKTKKNN